MTKINQIILDFMFLLPPYSSILHTATLLIVSCKTIWEFWSPIPEKENGKIQSLTSIFNLRENWIPQNCSDDMHEKHFHVQLFASKVILCNQSGVNFFNALFISSESILIFTIIIIFTIIVNILATLPGPFSKNLKKHLVWPLKVFCFFQNRQNLILFIRKI